MYSKIIVMLCALVWLHSVSAQETVQLNALTSMAEEELQAEIGYVPDQQSFAQQQALAHHLTRAQNNIQTTTARTSPIPAVDMLAQAPVELPQLSPFLQQYVHAIAAGLSSSDPTQGLSIMMQSAGVSPQQASARDRGALVIEFSNLQLGQTAQQFPQSFK